MTDKLTTKVNTISDNVKTLHKMLYDWQQALKRYAHGESCHYNANMEFLGKFAQQVDKTFVALTRFVEIQDIVTQFAHFQNRKLVGLSDLPQAVINSVLKHLKAVPDLSLTIKALEDGFPLLMDPVTEYSKESSALTLRTLFTIPRITSKDALCTIETLSSLTYKIGSRCFTGPLSRHDLVLITCANRKLVLEAAVLTACFSEHNALLCPEKLLTNADDVAWLGFPWTTGSNLEFQRNHVEVKCPTALHPIHHLGGRNYLSVVEKELKLTSLVIQLSPLSIFHVPCNETNNLLETGFGNCPKTLTISIPLFRRDNVQYVPWVPSSDDNTLDLHYQSLEVSPRLVFNKTVINALDNTFNRIDNNVHKNIKKIRAEIKAMHETQETTDAMIVAAVALSLTFINSIVLITSCCLYRKINKSQNDRLSKIVVQYKKEPIECVECKLPLNEQEEQEEDDIEEKQDGNTASV